MATPFLFVRVYSSTGVPSFVLPYGLWVIPAAGLSSAGAARAEHRPTARAANSFLMESPRRVEQRVGDVIGAREVEPRVSARRPRASGVNNRESPGGAAEGSQGWSKRQRAPPRGGERE